MEPRTAPARALRLAAALLLIALPAPARADSADCARSSLGALSERAQAIALARITGPEGARVGLAPVRVLKGSLGDAPQVAPHPTLPSEPGARVLVFLTPAAEGWTCLEAIPLTRPEQAQALAAAVTARIERDAAALFEQLLSPEPRVRSDAALDLLAAEGARAVGPARATLRRALATRPSLELLQLAQRLAGPDLVEPLVALARTAPHPVLQAAACRALAASDRAAALEALSADLAGDSLSAPRALGYLGGPEAGARLSQALRQEERAPQRLALLCALADCRRGDAALLAEFARAPRHPGEDRLALAVLARCSQGRVLRDLQQSLPDPALRDLARALRRDPVDLARRTLRSAEETLARLAQEARREQPPAEGR